MSTPKQLWWLKLRHQWVANSWRLRRVVVRISVVASLLAKASITGAVVRGEVGTVGQPIPMPGIIPRPHITTPNSPLLKPGSNASYSMAQLLLVGSPTYLVPCTYVVHTPCPYHLKLPLLAHPTTYLGLLHVGLLLLNMLILCSNMTMGLLWLSLISGLPSTP